MSQLSSKEKQELQQAVDRVLDHCSEGSMPDDAIIKTAQEMHLTPDRLPILVNAYNAGATAEHWSQGTSVREKTASFPIASLARIRQKLYPSQVKTASARMPEADNAFSRSPSAIFKRDPLDRYKEHIPMQKQASVVGTRQLIQTDVGIREGVEKIASRLQRELESAQARITFGMDKLAGIARRPDTPDYAELCEVAETVFGTPGRQIMAALGQDYPTLKKVSHLVADRGPLPASHPFFSQIRELIKDIDTCARSEALHKTAQATRKQIRTQLDERWKETIHGSEMTRTLLTPTQVKRAAEKKKIEKRAFREELDVPRPMTRLETMLNPGWQGATEREYGILNALNDPEHLADLRRISNEAMLADLMNTDEFLKQQDPEAVLEAYNDILEVSPNLRGKKMLIRQALREYMASETLDLATIGQLARMDSDLEAARDRKMQAQADQAQRFADAQQKVELARLERENAMAVERFKAEAAEESRARDRKQQLEMHRDALKQQRLDREQRDRHHDSDSEQRDTHHSQDLEQRDRMHKDDYNQRAEFKELDKELQEAFYKSDYEQKERHHEDMLVQRDNAESGALETQVAIEKARLEAQNEQAHEKEVARLYQEAARKAEADDRRNKSQDVDSTRAQMDAARIRAEIADKDLTAKAKLLTEAQQRLRNLETTRGDAYRLHLESKDRGGTYNQAAIESYEAAYETLSNQLNDARKQQQKAITERTDAVSKLTQSSAAHAAARANNSSPFTFPTKADWVQQNATRLPQKAPVASNLKHTYDPVGENTRKNREKRDPALPDLGKLPERTFTRL